MRRIYNMEGERNMRRIYNREVLPPYAGPRTFFRAPYVEFEDLIEGMVAIVGVPWDTTAGSRPGTRYGPQAIRDASVYLHYVVTSPSSEFVDIDSGEVYRRQASDRLVDLGDLNVYPADVQKTRQSIQDGVGAIVRSGAFPVILGGDHYIAFPAFVGFAEAMRDRDTSKIGYLQLDGHFDLHKDNPIFGPHFHGSNARLAIESGLADPKNFVWLGIRGSVRKDQYDFIVSSGASVFSFKKVRELGVRRAMEEAVACAARGVDLLYVTIDIDVVDPMAAPGTGAITFGGLTPMELLEAIEVLKQSPIGAIDLVEVAPPLDPTGATERLAATALTNFISPKIFAE
ncbi:MAG: agmatinase family protein [Anaerolineae bacterium]|nr:agmatinase family protein [Anaerolineae bacterium]